MKLYLIHEPTLNKFSRGGSYPKFRSAPKVWSRRCDFHNHLSLVEEYRLKYCNQTINPYKNCNVIIIDMKTQNFILVPFTQYDKKTDY